MVLKVELYQNDIFPDFSHSSQLLTVAINTEYYIDSFSFTLVPVYKSSLLLKLSKYIHPYRPAPEFTFSKDEEVIFFRQSCHIYFVRAVPPTTNLLQ